MKTRIKMLKVKIKSLAAEAKIIRLEEVRAGLHNDLRLREELWQHRTTDLRREQRVSMLAYAFLRGQPLSETEKKSKTRNSIDWKRVLKLSQKYGPVEGWTEDFTRAFEEWAGVKVTNFRAGPNEHTDVRPKS